VKASINSVPYWQMREIASNDGLLEQSDIRVHFGLNDASHADSIIIEWPSGTIESYSDIEANTYYIANEGNGILEPFVTSLQSESNYIPNKTKLNGNFPNPFNPNTNITYTLGTRAFVKLKIYNSLGEHINTIISDNQQAGNYIVQWNGKDAKGNSLASGIYFCQLTAGGFRKSRKMLLLK
jgi:hypothetical protein